MFLYDTIYYFFLCSVSPRSVDLLVLYPCFPSYVLICYFKTMLGIFLTRLVVCWSDMPNGSHKVHFYWLRTCHVTSQTNFLYNISKTRNIASKLVELTIRNNFMMHGRYKNYWNEDLTKVYFLIGGYKEKAKILSIIVTFTQHWLG